MSYVNRVAEVLLLGVCFAVGCRTGGEPSSATVVEVPGLRFSLPAGWQQVPPTSRMRAAQATIPGAAGSGEMAVFFFGAGQGGGAEPNLQRWMQQITPDAGGEPQRSSFEGDGLRVTWVDMRGTLQPGQMGMGPAEAQPNSELLGAVVEGDGGPWFIKATGPEATLAPQRDAFVALLRSMKLVAKRG
jgi:hypothetical protein